MKSGLVAVCLALVFGCAMEEKVARPDSAETQPVSAAEARRQIVLEVKKSGPSDEPWTVEAPSVFSRWTGSAKKAAGSVRFSPVVCYRLGCMTTATYRTVAAVETVDRSLSVSEPFLKWSGPKHRTSVEVQDDGTASADWILFRPREGANGGESR